MIVSKREILLENSNSNLQGNKEIDLGVNKSLEIIKEFKGGKF